jgi:hypothetical protein
MSIFGAIWGALKFLGRLFTSPAAKEAFGLVDAFLPKVAPIVKEIQEHIPNVSTATLGDVKNVYSAFGVALDDVKENPVSFGTALASLALTVVRSRFNDTSTPSRIIKAAIELALVGLKAK